MIDELLAIDDNIALDSGDPALNNDVRALNLVSLIAEEASEQRGLLAYAFAQEGPFNPQVLSDVTTALEEQTANIAEYNRVATPQQVALYTSSVAGSLVDFASSYELQAIQYGEDGKPLNLSATTANEWVGAMSTGTIGGIDTVQQKLVATTISRASALRRQAIETASVVGAGGPDRLAARAAAHHASSAGPWSGRCGACGPAPSRSPAYGCRRRSAG